MNLKNVYEFFGCCGDICLPIANANIAKLPELNDTISDLEDENFDYAIIGESDHGFSKIINKIAEDKSPDEMPGIVKRESKKKFIINHPEKNLDISNLHAPARHLVNM